MENQEQEITDRILEQQFTERLTRILMLVNPSRGNNRFIVISDVTKIQHSIIFSPSLLSGLFNEFYIINERMIRIIRRNASISDCHNIYVRDLNDIFYRTTGYEINRMVKILGCSLTKAVCDCLDISMSMNINRGYIGNSNDYFSAAECANITQNPEYMKNLRNNFRNNPVEFKQDFFKAFTLAILGNINPYVLASPENSGDSEVDKILVSVISTMKGNCVRRDILRKYYMSTLEKSSEPITNLDSKPNPDLESKPNPDDKTVFLPQPNPPRYVSPTFVMPTFTPFSLGESKDISIETKPNPNERTTDPVDILLSDSYVRNFLDSRLGNYYPLLFKDKQYLFRLSVNDCIQKKGIIRPNNTWETNAGIGMQLLRDYNFTIVEFMKCFKSAMPAPHAWIWEEIKNDKTFSWPDIQR